MRTALLIALVCVALYLAHAYLLTTESTVALRPGETVRLDNTRGRTVHVRAAYPVTLTRGECRAPQIVEYDFRCDGPADVLTITDSRFNPFAASNRVTVRYSLLRF